jgi:hypothetical protein
MATTGSMKKNKKSFDMSDEHTWHSLVIAIASLVVFFYRIIMLGYPMFMDGIKTQQYDKALMSLTLLV